MLTEKEAELIAIGASIAAGCQPCTTYHFRAARLAGAAEDEIAAGGERRAEHPARRHRGYGAAGKPARHEGGRRTRPSVSNGSPVRLLVLVGAAYAANCVPILDAHLAAAKRLGIAGDDIFAALKVACAIKSMADKKVHAAAARALGGSESDGDSEGCGCGESEEQVPTQGRGSAGKCSCRD